jgi:hypothetical protein
VYGVDVVVRIGSESALLIAARSRCARRHKSSRDNVTMSVAVAPAQAQDDTLRPTRPDLILDLQLALLYSLIHARAQCSTGLPRLVNAGAGASSSYHSRD